MKLHRVVSSSKNKNSVEVVVKDFPLPGYQTLHLKFNFNDGKYYYCLGFKYVWDSEKKKIKRIPIPAIFPSELAKDLLSSRTILILRDN